jgi:hypothetical protein
MKFSLLILIAIVLNLVGCAATRMPASEINEARAKDADQERYIYGGSGFARESQL